MNTDEYILNLCSIVNCVYRSDKLNIHNIDIPLVISYENDFTTNLNSQFFRQTLEQNNWEYMFIGENTKWLGFKNKLYGYYKILSYLPKDKIVVFSDARDVICVRPSLPFKQKISDKIEQKKIIVSSEMFLLSHMDWTNDEINTCIQKDIEYFWQGKPLDEYWKYHNIETKPLRKYVNSGLIAGKSLQLMLYFKWAIDNNYTDDQLSLAEYTNKYPECVFLDYNADILHTSTACVSGGFYDVNMQKDDSPTFSELLGLTNYFLHIPGLSISKGQNNLYNCVCNSYKTIKLNAFDIYSISPSNINSYINKTDR